jgi:hypothetical protein
MQPNPNPACRTNRILCREQPHLLNGQYATAFSLRDLLNILSGRAVKTGGEHSPEPYRRTPLRMADQTSAAGSHSSRKEIETWAYPYTIAVISMTQPPFAV